MTNDQPVSLACVTDRITAYLTDHLARTQPDFPETLHTNMSFDYMGLDSLSRVELISALSKEWSVDLDLTAAYDFVTIGALAEFVWKELTINRTDAAH